MHLHHESLTFLFTKPIRVFCPSTVIDTSQRDWLIDRTPYIWIRMTCWKTCCSLFTLLIALCLWQLSLVGHFVYHLKGSSVQTISKNRFEGLWTLAHCAPLLAIRFLSSWRRGRVGALAAAKSAHSCSSRGSDSSTKFEEEAPNGDSLHSAITSNCLLHSTQNCFSWWNDLVIFLYSA